MFERRGVALGLQAEAFGEVQVEHVPREGGLARTGNPGDADEQPERNVNVEFPEVVAGRAADRQHPLAGLAPRGRHRDGFFAGQPRESADLRLLPDGGGGPLIDKPATKGTRARAQVDQVIGGPHDFLFVFDHHQGVALVAQAVHDADQALNVALVQAHRGFIQHEQRAGERGSQTGG